MKIKSREDLFTAWLYEIYSAEKQIADILPRIIDKSTDPELKDVFRNHLRETERQVVRLDEIFKILNCEIEDRKCIGMVGLVEEAGEMMRDVADRNTLDVVLIAIVRKIERYEIFCYEALCALGDVLGRRDAVMLLRRTLMEEKAADEALHAMILGAETWNMAAPLHGREGSGIAI